MNKTRIIGIIVVLILFCIGIVSAVAINNYTKQNSAKKVDSQQGLSNDEIRNGLMNHGVNHKEGGN